MDPQTQQTPQPSNDQNGPTPPQTQSFEPVAQPTQDAMTFSPTIAPTPVAAPQPVLQPQPIVPSGRKKFKTMTPAEVGKRVTLLGNILFWVSVAGILVNVASTYYGGTMSAANALSENVMNYVLLALQALIGIGLVKRNMIAYYAFRVVGIIVLISLLLVLAWLPFLGLALVAFSSAGSSTEFSLGAIIFGLFALIYAANYFFWIYGLFLTNTKTAKSLFQKQAPQQPQPPVAPSAPTTPTPIL
jgi:hypothetical protein